MPEERKVVTVLFADVVGSTAIGGRHDPEVIRAAMARYFDRVRGLAEIHGGTVEKFIGDAAMVVFGVPRVHEDDPERAVRAALAMRDAVSEMRAELPFELAIRIGVNTGEVVAATEGDQLLVTGDAVNVAARLQQAADPGQILVGERTEAATRDAVASMARPPIVAKGRARPVPAFEAIATRTLAPGRARGLRRPRADLVGRERELRLVVEAFDRAVATRRAAVATLMGAPGVGKSRLAEEALARIAARGGVGVLRGRCLPYGAGITYWPLAEVIRADAGLGATEDRAAARARVDARAAELFASPGEAARVVARIGVVLGLDSPERALAEVSADRIGAELTWGMRRYMEALALQRPLVAVIDDLQWAERAVVEALDALADVAGPLLLLGIARRELLETVPGWMAGRANAALITLEPLGPDDMEELLSRLIGGELPEPLHGRLLRRAAGNPLFLEEYVRGLIERGDLVREDGGWRSIGTDPAVYQYVPETVQAVIAARIDLLRPHERAVLRTAAVIGERLRLGELEALVGGLGLGYAPEGLVRKGLLVDEMDPAGERLLRFGHLLIRDVAYESLPKSDRLALHDAYRALIERALPDPSSDLAEILAYHGDAALGCATDLRRPVDEIVRLRAHALRWHRAAAARALGLHALDSAHAHIDAAFPLAADADPIVQSELYAGRGRAFELAGRYDKAVATYVEMCDAARARGDAWMEATALGLHATVLAIPSARHDPAAADALLDRAVELARTSGSGELLAKLLTDRVLTAFWSGHLDAGIAAGEHALAIARGLGDREREAYALSALSRVHQTQGDVGRTRAVLVEAERIFRELGARAMVVDCLCSLSTVDLLVGDLTTSLERAREAVAIATEIGNAWGRSFARHLESRALAEMGDLGGAIAAMRDSVALAVEAGFVGDQVASATELALLYVAAGQHQLADKSASEAEGVAFFGLQEWRAYPLGARALVSADREAWLEAEQIYEHATRSLVGDPAWYTPRLVLDLAAARIALGSGRVDDAAAVAAEAARRHRERGILLTVLDLELVAAQALRLGGKPREALAVLDRPVDDAERTGARRVLWQVLSTRAAVRETLGQTADAARDRAAALAIVERIARSLEPVGMAASFRATREVSALLASTT